MQELDHYQPGRLNQPGDSLSRWSENASECVDIEPKAKVASVQMEQTTRVAENQLCPAQGKNEKSGSLSVRDNHLSSAKDREAIVDNCPLSKQQRADPELTLMIKYLLLGDLQKASTGIYVLPIKVKPLTITRRQNKIINYPQHINAIRCCLRFPKYVVYVHTYDVK